MPRALTLAAAGKGRRQPCPGARQIRSWTLTEPNTHHPLKSFFFSEPRVREGLAQVARGALLGPLRPVVHGAVAEPAHFLDEEFFDFVGGAQTHLDRIWSEPGSPRSVPEVVGEGASLRGSVFRERDPLGHVDWSWTGELEQGAPKVHIIVIKIFLPRSLGPLSIAPGFAGVMSNPVQALAARRSLLRAKGPATYQPRAERAEGPELVEGGTSAALGFRR